MVVYNEKDKRNELANDLRNWRRSVAWFSVGTNLSVGNSLITPGRHFRH